MSDSHAMWDGQPFEYWVRTLRDAEDDVRWKAVDALRHIGPPSETVELFIAALSDPCWQVRALAAHALYDMAHEEELSYLVCKFVLHLARTLSDESPEVALNAAYTLELLGPNARAALPLLRKMAANRDDRIRRAANDAMISIESLH